MKKGQYNVTKSDKPYGLFCFKNILHAPSAPVLIINMSQIVEQFKNIENAIKYKSQMVQWLGLWASTAGATGSIPD